MKSGPSSFSKESMLIRLIEKNDNVEIAAVIRKVLEEHGVDRPGTVYTDPTTDQLFELFQTEGACYYVAKDNDVIIGGCGIYPTEGLPDGCAELVKLYVLQDYRGIGLGKSLMKHAIDFAQEHYSQLYLETMPELSNAVALYEELGFKSLPDRMGNSGHFSCHIWMLKDLR
jgi:putative acetyltransferase